MAVRVVPAAVWCVGCGVWGVGCVWGVKNSPKSKIEVQSPSVRFVKDVDSDCRPSFNELFKYDNVVWSVELKASKTSYLIVATQYKSFLGRK